MTLPIIPKLGVVLITLMLVACSTLTYETTQVKITEQASYIMQGVPPSMVGHTYLQKLLIVEQNNQHELLLQTELQQNSIQMVGLSLSGIQLFHLSWQQNGELVVKQNLGITDIPAQQLLTYYQLANWPINILKKGLIGMTIVSTAEQPNTRNFFENGTLTFSFSRCLQVSKFIHHKNNYQITIESLD